MLRAILQSCVTLSESQGFDLWTSGWYLSAAHVHLFRAPTGYHNELPFSIAEDVLDGFGNLQQIFKTQPCAIFARLS